MSRGAGQRSGKLIVPNDRGEMVELEKARREAEESRGLRDLAQWAERALRSRRLVGQPLPKQKKTRTKAQIRGRARSKAARQMRKRQRRLSRR